jgi:hypothetical protein
MVISPFPDRGDHSSSAVPPRSITATALLRPDRAVIVMKTTEFI